MARVIQYSERGGLCYDKYVEGTLRGCSGCTVPSAQMYIILYGDAAPKQVL